MNKPQKERVSFFSAIFPKLSKMASHVPNEANNIFTPRAIFALASARKEARRFNNGFIGAEHMLLGVLDPRQVFLIKILKKLGVNSETIRQEIELSMEIARDSKIAGKIPYTPRVKRVLALAIEEAKALNHSYVGTEHILLGLLREEDDEVVGHTLKKFGIEIEKVRMEVQKELDPIFKRGN